MAPLKGQGLADLCEEILGFSMPLKHGPIEGVATA